VNPTTLSASERREGLVLEIIKYLITSTMSQNAMPDPAAATSAYVCTTDYDVCKEVVNIVKHYDEGLLQFEAKVVQQSSVHRSGTTWPFPPAVMQEERQRCISKYVCPTLWTWHQWQV
jgi:hypothetical protein